MVVARCCQYSWLVDGTGLRDGCRPRPVADWRSQGHSAPLRCMLYRCSSQLAGCANTKRQVFTISVYTQRQNLSSRFFFPTSFCCLGSWCSCVSAAPSQQMFSTSIFQLFNNNGTSFSVAHTTPRYTYGHRGILRNIYNYANLSIYWQNI